MRPPSAQRTSAITDADRTSWTRTRSPTLEALLAAGHHAVGRDVDDQEGELACVRAEGTRADNGRFSVAIDARDLSQKADSPATQTHTRLIRNTLRYKGDGYPARVNLRPNEAA